MIAYLPWSPLINHFPDKKKRKYNVHPRHQTTQSQRESNPRAITHTTTITEHYKKRALVTKTMRTPCGVSTNTGNFTSGAFVPLPEELSIMI